MKRLPIFVLVALISAALGGYLVFEYVINALVSASSARVIHNIPPYLREIGAARGQIENGDYTLAIETLMKMETSYVEQVNSLTQEIYDAGDDPAIGIVLESRSAIEDLGYELDPLE